MITTNLNIATKWELDEFPADDQVRHRCLGILLRHENEELSRKRDKS